MWSAMSVEFHHVVDAGSTSDAPTVVLSSSLGSSHRLWDRHMPDLVRHSRVVRYATRGGGRSSVPSGPYTIDDLSNDVVVLLDRFNLERVHLSVSRWAG